MPLPAPVLTDAIVRVYVEIQLLFLEISKLLLFIALLSRCSTGEKVDHSSCSLWSRLYKLLGKK